MKKYIVTTTNYVHNNESGGHVHEFYDDTIYIATLGKSINLTPEILQYAWAFDMTNYLFEEYHDGDDSRFTFNQTIIDTQVGEIVSIMDFHFDASNGYDVETTAEYLFKEFPKWRVYALPGFDALEVEHDDDESISPHDFIQKFDDISLLEMRREMKRKCDEAWSAVEHIVKDYTFEEIVFRMEFAEQWLKNGKGGA